MKQKIRQISKNFEKTSVYTTQPYNEKNKNVAESIR